VRDSDSGSGPAACCEGDWQRWPPGLTGGALRRAAPATKIHALLLISVKHANEGRRGPCHNLHRERPRKAALAQPRTRPKRNRWNGDGAKIEEITRKVKRYSLTPFEAPFGRGANRAVWISVLAGFQTGLRPIWRIADDLLATGTSFFLPAALHHHQRSLGHALQRSNSRLCSFGSLLFVQTSFPPSPRPFSPPFGMAEKLAADVSQESTNWGLY